MATRIPTKQTAKPSLSMTGYVKIQEGDETILSFWAWEAKSVYKHEKNGLTAISFPKMWLSTSAPVDEVSNAMGAAMLMWSQHEDKNKKTRTA